MMKKMSKSKNERYSAMTMVETLITLLIVGLVLIVVSATLTALIKASTISAARTTSRNESEIVLEILERYIENAQSDEIFLYSSTPPNSPANSRYVTRDGVIAGIPGSLHLVNPDGNEVANEMHIRPIGGDEWVCIAFYPGDPEDDAVLDLGYIVKKTSPFQDADCFLNDYGAGSGEGHIFLTSDEVDINSLDFKVTNTSSENFIFVIDLALEPVNWVPGPQSKFEPEYIRQLVVSTEKLTF